jgi:hypothetical protein
MLESIGTGLREINIHISQATVASAFRISAVTGMGYIGLVPQCAKTGDSAYILSIVSLPFLVRQSDAGKHILPGYSAKAKHHLGRV